MKEVAVVISNANKEITPFETIDAVAEAGFKNVFIQWYNKNWNPSQENQLEYIKQKGLKVIFAHLGYQNINDIWEDFKDGDDVVERYINDIRVCKKYGIDLVVMHLTSKTDTKPFNELGLNRIKKIIEFAESIDVKIAFENTKIKGYIDKVIDNIKSDNIGICYDAGHCHLYFNDEFKYKKYKDKIFAVHLHDNDKTDDLHLIPYDGTINWDYVAQNLKENNYDGPITLEVVYRRDYLKETPLEFYKKAYAIAEKLAKKFENE